MEEGVRGGAFRMLIAPRCSSRASLRSQGHVTLSFSTCQATSLNT